MVHDDDQFDFVEHVHDCIEFIPSGLDIPSCYYDDSGRVKEDHYLKPERILVYDNYSC